MNGQTSEIMEDLGKGELNRGTVIMFHLTLIGKCASEPLAVESDKDDAFRNSIRFLECLLRGKYHSYEDYTLEKKKIMCMSNPKNRISTTAEYFLWLGLLMEELTKSGLEPIGMGSIYDMDDGEDNKTSTEPNLETQQK